MQTIKQLITAAGGYQASIAGRTLLVQACDQGTALTVVLTDVFGNRETVIGVGAGAKLTPATGFTSVSISTTADANVQFIITTGDIDIQLTSIGSVITNTNANPVPVALVSEPGAPFPVTAGADFPVKNGASALHVTVDGTVNVSGATMTATNVGVNNTTANPVPVQLHVSDITLPVSGAVSLTPGGSAVTDVAAQAVGTAGASVIAASAGRKRLIFRNTGTGQLAITSASGTTFANAAVVLQPGDAWKEVDAPQLQWFAVSDVGTNVTIQTVS